MAEATKTFTLTLNEDEAHAVAAVLGKCLPNPLTSAVYDALTEQMWGADDYLHRATIHANVEREDGSRSNVIEVR